MGEQLPGFDALAHYESALNKFAARYPLGFLCMYDMSEIDGCKLADWLISDGLAERLNQLDTPSVRG